MGWQITVQNILFEIWNKNLCKTRSQPIFEKAENTFQSDSVCSIIITTKQLFALYVLYNKAKIIFLLESISSWNWKRLPYQTSSVSFLWEGNCEQTNHRCIVYFKCRTRRDNLSSWPRLFHCIVFILVLSCGGGGSGGGDGGGGGGGGEAGGGGGGGGGDGGAGGGVNIQRGFCK